MHIISKKFSLSLKEILTAYKLIESWGYRLKKTKVKIEFLSAPDALIDSEISYKLKTTVIGKKVVSYHSVKSTNIVASELASVGEGEGTIVTAETQTKGKGRLGRKWHSPEKSGIYLSIILKPKFKPEKAPGLSIMTAVALADTCKSFTGANVQIKWPNDLLLNSKKVAGILTELSADKNKIEYVIIGVGINLNQKSDDFPEELRKTATSIRRINKRKVDRILFLKKFLYQFEKQYLSYQKYQLKAVQKKVRSYSSLIGSKVKLAQGNSIIEGVAVQIDESGALIVNNGEKDIRINSGEVTVIKEK